MTEAAQLDAILHGAAFAAITDRAFLRVTGADATRWLNGMVTNNIAALAPGEGNYNFLLNAQGRIQGDCTIYREPGDGPPTFLLETQHSQLETVQKTLDHFIIMDDVELTNGLQIIGHPAVGIRVFGSNAAHLVHGLLSEINDNDDGTPLWAPRPGTMTLANTKRKTYHLFVVPNEGLAIVMTPPISSTLCFDIWMQDERALEWVKKSVASQGAVQASIEILDAFRIYSRTPKFGIDIRDRDLPQETGQTHALHFSKGCYLGQEIVERIRSRGQVHRQFTQFRLTGEMPATLPTPLETNGKPAGELTSAAQIGDTIYALGYVRREALDTRQALTYPEGTAIPSPLRTNN